MKKKTQYTIGFGSGATIIALTIISVVGLLTNVPEALWLWVGYGFYKIYN
jgi:hypothetical protein